MGLTSKVKGVRSCLFCRFWSAYNEKFQNAPIYFVMSAVCLFFRPPVDIKSIIDQQIFIKFDLGEFY
jgi:hypothetical protein